MYNNIVFFDKKEKGIYLPQQDPPFLFLILVLFREMSTPALLLLGPSWFLLTRSLICLVIVKKASSTFEDDLAEVSRKDIPKYDVIYIIHYVCQIYQCYLQILWLH